MITKKLSCQKTEKIEAGYWKYVNFKQVKTFLLLNKYNQNFVRIVLCKMFDLQKHKTEQTTIFQIIKTFIFF